MSSAFLHMQGLKKSFAFKPVLRGLDLTLERGQCMALLGANGAGKTTLLRILAGLTRPSAGTVSIGEFDLVRDAQRVRACVGFVAHQPYLYEELTALENLSFFGKMYAIRDIRARAQHLLCKVGLEKKAGERVSVLSRGQVQRLALARALLHEPQFLLLDEPDTGLDQEGHALIETLLKAHIAQGGSVLFTTHQLERALELGDSIIMLKGGRIAWQQQTVGVELDSISRAYQEVTVP